MADLCRKCKQEITDPFASTCPNCGKKLDPPQPMMVLQGSDGTVSLYAHKIVIKQKGLLSKMNKGLVGEKDIYLTSISGVQVKKPTMMTKGYIQFLYVGSQDTKGGIFGAVKDENTVLFTGGEYKKAVEIKEHIERLMHQPKAPTIIEHAPVSTADEIAKLANLRDQGIITKDEFEGEKKRLLRK